MPFINTKLFQSFKLWKRWDTLILVSVHKLLINASLREAERRSNLNLKYHISHSSQDLNLLLIFFYNFEIASPDTLCRDRNDGL